MIKTPEGELLQNERHISRGGGMSPSPTGEREPANPNGKYDSGGIF